MRRPGRGAAPLRTMGRLLSRALGSAALTGAREAPRLARGRAGRLVAVAHRSARSAAARSLPDFTAAGLARRSALAATLQLGSGGPGGGWATVGCVRAGWWTTQGRVGRGTAGRAGSLRLGRTPRSLGRRLSPCGRLLRRFRRFVRPLLSLTRLPALIARLLRLVAALLAGGRIVPLA
jgi:hypothetical protein